MLIIAPGKESLKPKMKVGCVLSLESPHKGDSNKYTKQTLSIKNKKITRDYPKSNNVCSYGIFFERDSITSSK